MNWEAMGAIAELAGAGAVVFTLFYLAVQVRHSRALLQANRAATEEGTRLARAAALDRHSDAVSRWRGRLIADRDVAQIWHKALEGDEVDDTERLRLENLWVDWINTYRSSFRHAKAVGDDGLAHQVVVSVVETLSRSAVMQELWEWGRPFNELAASDFVGAVEQAAEARRQLREGR